MDAHAIPWPNVAFAAVIAFGFVGVAWAAAWAYVKTAPEREATERERQRAWTTQLWAITDTTTKGQP